MSFIQIYSEQDTSKMPLELASALLIEREPVDDPEIRVQALESIYLISLQVRLVSFSVHNHLTPLNYYD